MSVMDKGLSGETLLHSFFKNILLEGYVGEGVVVVHFHASLGKEGRELFPPFLGIVKYIVHPAEYAALNIVDEFFLRVILEL